MQPKDAAKTKGNSERSAMSDVEKERIRQLALSCGFKLKEQADGSQDLNEYVYAFSKAIENAAYERAAKVCDPEFMPTSEYLKASPFIRRRIDAEHGLQENLATDIRKLKSSPAGE
jgi:hypothetical protein